MHVKAISVVGTQQRFAHTESAQPTLLLTMVHAWEALCRGGSDRRALAAWKGSPFKHSIHVSYSLPLYTFGELLAVLCLQDAMKTTQTDLCAWSQTVEIAACAAAA